MPDRLNIIYFVSHDTGRFLGTYGRPIRFSPNLDRFAAQSIQFNRSYCSAPCCGPSRNCAMTGKYSHVTGTLGLGNMGWCLPDDQKTAVDYFNDAGHQTVHMGFCHERCYGDMRYQLDGQVGVDEHYWKCDSRLVVDNAIDYLKLRDRSKNFYLNLATNETHAGHMGGTLAPRHGPAVPLEDAWLPPTTPDLPGIRQRYAHWYASLKYMDGHFGRLVDAIDELGLAANTLVVYTTDHGIGAHRGKGHVYEQGVEIGLLVRPPKGYKAGYSVDHLIPNIDYLPTWLEATGLPIPKDINGQSFWPIIAGETYRPHEHVFIERNFHGELAAPYATDYVDKYDPQRLVRTADYAYIRHFWPSARPRQWYSHEIIGFDHIPGREYGELSPEQNHPRPAEELYDMRHDPWQQVNLAARPDYRQIKAGLAAELDRWMHETHDPALKGVMPPPLQAGNFWPTRHHPIPAPVRV